MIFRNQEVKVNHRSTDVCLCVFVCVSDLVKFADDCMLKMHMHECVRE